MKTSMKKLRGFGLQRHDVKQHRLQHSTPHLDELSQASQDMLDMKECYESLLSAAAATANSAFEFSESLREMGDCLLEKTAMNDDEESAKVLLMLGKVHFELQKFVDRYRAHISKTISAPSESLLNELCIVEEMKRQCDEKRDGYEEMMARHKEKGWLRSSKGETFSREQLQAAREEYEEEATLFVFRMKSLKRGRSQSLLTQAARHHAAQLCFFRKGLKSLEAIEPHVESITAQQHIDYQFSGLEDDGDDSHDDDDDDYGSDSSDGFEVDDDDDDGELSFADGQSDQGQGASKSRSSMELYKVDELTFPKVAVVNSGKENIYRNQGGGYSFGFGREGLKTGEGSSKSAPLSAENRAERFNQMLRHSSSSRKLQTYVLPTPTPVVEEKSTTTTTNYSGSIITPVPQQTTATHNLWHSSPLEHKKKTEDILGNDKFSGPILTQSVLKRSSYYNNNNNTTTTTSSRLSPTPPLTEGLASPQHGVSYSANKKIKRPAAFSGPLTEKSRSNNNNNPILLYASGPILSTGNPQHLFSGSLLRSPPPMPPPSSSSSFQNFSTSGAASSFVSSPKISELHELPRPPSPPHLEKKRPPLPPNLMRHSAPLVPNGENLWVPSKKVVVMSKSNAAAGSKLPLPPQPQTVARSYSIPSRGGGQPLDDALLPTKMKADIHSSSSHPPPLIPIITLSTA